MDFDRFGQLKPQGSRQFLRQRSQSGSSLRRREPIPTWAVSALRSWAMPGLGCALREVQAAWSAGSPCRYFDPAR